MCGLTDKPQKDVSACLAAIENLSSVMDRGYAHVGPPLDPVFNQQAAHIVNLNADEIATISKSMASNVDRSVEELECALDETGGTNGPIDWPDSPSPLDDSPCDMLKPVENDLLKRAVHYIEESRAHRTSPLLHAAPLALHIIVQGGAGVGKSTFANTLVCRAHRHINCTAYTGSAVAKLPCGSTTANKLFDIPVFENKKATAQGSITPMAVGTLADRRRAFANIHLIIIDEISLVNATLLQHINLRCQEILQTTLPFGGLGVVAMGDMHQLPPPYGMLDLRKLCALS